MISVLELFLGEVRPDTLAPPAFRSAPYSHESKINFELAHSKSSKKRYLRLGLIWNSRSYRADLTRRQFPAPMNNISNEREFAFIVIPELLHLREVFETVFPGKLLDFRHIQWIIVDPYIPIVVRHHPAYCHPPDFNPLDFRAEEYSDPLRSRLAKPNVTVKRLPDLERLCPLRADRVLFASAEDERYKSLLESE
jgi:hypothetical protein